MVASLGAMTAKLHVARKVSCTLLSFNEISGLDCDRSCVEHSI